MWSSSILFCSANTLSSSLSFSHFSPLPVISPKHHTSSIPSFSFSCSCFSNPDSKLQSTATQEVVETRSSASSFVETGYVYGVHGFQGEVRVKTSTEFSELRFSKPGIRWLKQQLSGAETLQEIELVDGQGHPGQSWIVKFNSIDTIEQSKKLVGSTILVKDDDRPALEEGDFYTHDLVGMRVILQASGEN